MANKLYLHIAEFIEGVTTILKHGKMSDFDTDVLKKHSLVTGRQRQQNNRFVQGAIKTAKNDLERRTRTLSVFHDGVSIGYATGVWVKLAYDQIHVSSNRYDSTNYRYYALNDGDRHIDVTFSIECISADTFTKIELAVFKNEVQYKTLDFIETVEDKFFLGGNCLVYMECGDYIDIRFKHQDGDPINGVDIINVFGYWDIMFAGCNRTKVNDVILFIG